MIYKIHPPNGKQLIISLGCPLPADPEEVTTLLPLPLEDQDSPLLSTHDNTVKLTCEHDTVGMDLLNLLDRDHV